MPLSVRSLLLAIGLAQRCHSLLRAWASPQITSNKPSQILQQYRSFRTTWIINIRPYAHTLFALLAIIEFAWSAAAMALEKTDLQSWTSALGRTIMWLGAFYALLLYGRQWIPAIIDSFSQLGGTTAGINGNQGLSPSDVFTQGLNIAAALMDAASSSAFFTNPGTGLAVMLAAALVVIAFIAVTIQFPFGLVTASALWASNVAARSQRSRAARSENGSEVSMPRRTDLTGRIRTVGLVARFVAGSAIGLTLVADKVLSRAVESATRSARMFLLAVAGVLCVGNLALVNAHRKGRGA